ALRARGCVSQYQRIVLEPADDLEPGRKPVAGESARDGRGRQGSQVKWVSERGPAQVARFLAVDRAGVVLADRESRAWHRRCQEQVVVAHPVGPRCGIDALIGARPGY